MGLGHTFEFLVGYSLTIINYYSIILGNLAFWGRNFARPKHNSRVMDCKSTIHYCERFIVINIPLCWFTRSV